MGDVRRSFRILIAATASSFATMAIGQTTLSTVEEIERAERGKIAKPAPNAGPLIDEGNQAAKDLAAREGISIGEATRDLRLSR